jgi:ribosomal protein L23
MKTSTSTGKRSMKPNLQARIDEIAFDLSNGLSRNEIVRKIEKKYNIKSDQVDKYIRKAKDQAERQRQDNKTAVVNNYHLKEIEARIEALISKEQIIKGFDPNIFQ